MDKAKKLKRYQRKDYTQAVSFPVEIVGRDGLVRQYSFSESVRLYQRRIASCELRYHDPEISRAESEHCQARIRQLRRSFFHHFGWDAIREDNPGKELSGEVVAFLLRYLSEEPDGLHLRRVEGANFPIWVLEGLPALEGCLLYLYPFEGPGPCELREAFFCQIRLGQQSAGLEIERVVAFHHTSDCGLVLTGRGEGFPLAGSPAKQLVWAQQESNRNLHDAFQLGIQALSNGDAEEAMVHFDLAIAQNPYRHQLHACVVAVCDYLDRPEELAIAVRVGLHYFPASTSLNYMAALSRFRFSDWEGVERILEENPEIFGNFPARHRALTARLALRAGDWGKAAAALRRASGVQFTEVDSVLHHASLRRLIGIRRALNTGVALLSVGGVVALGFQPSVAVAMAGSALGLAVLREWPVAQRIRHHLAVSRRYLGLGLPKDLSLDRGSS